MQLRAQLTQNLSKDRPHTSPMSPVSDGDVLKDGGGESWLSRYDDATSPPPPPQDTRPRTPTIIPIRTAATGAPAPATPAKEGKPRGISHAASLSCCLSRALSLSLSLPLTVFLAPAPPALRRR